MSAEMKTSQEWVYETGVTILDPDGWDRRNFFYSFHQQRITREQFDRRVAMSTTCVYRPSNEDRIAALEEKVARLTDRFESTLEVNEMWDGS